MSDSLPTETQVYSNSTLPAETSLPYGHRIANQAKSHFDWIESVGWHNKTILEAIALIYSEISELSRELVTSAEYSEELADIVLRHVDLMLWQGIEFPTEKLTELANSYMSKKLAEDIIRAKVAIQEEETSKPRLLSILSITGDLANSARKIRPTEEFLKQAYLSEDKKGTLIKLDIPEEMSRVSQAFLIKLFETAFDLRIDLESQLERKITKNQSRGTRGRLV